MNRLLRNRATGIALAVLLLVFAARLTHTAIEKSFTVDEPIYVLHGAHIWKTGDLHYWRTLRLHPPLAFHLASALPILLLDAADEEMTRGSQISRVLSHNDPPAARVRLLARIPFILLSCWGAILIFTWGREASGDAAGLLAVFLYTFSPTILGNGWVAHSDIAVSVFYLQTLYLFWRWTRRPRMGELLLCGVSLGLALLSKSSALILAATLALIVVSIAMKLPIAGAPSTQPGPDSIGARVRWSAMVLGVVGVSATVVLWLGYGGSAAMVEAPADSGFAGWKVPSYFASLLVFQQANELGRTAFLFGEYSKQGWWYFFPAALLVKMPLAVLGLIGLSFFVRGRGRGAFHRILGTSIACYALVACLLWNVPMGIRYVLPAILLVQLWVATAVAPSLASWIRIPVIGLCLWLAAASLWIHPHYLAYFNPLVGGPSQGYRFLVGSDLDWGQDLGTLARYLKERGNPPVWLAYFGRERAEHHGIRAQPLVGCEPRSGLVAISASILQRMYAPPGATSPAPEGCYGWLQARTPVAQPGYSILVYELGSPSS
jgi:hypothetical protein